MQFAVVMLVCVLGTPELAYAKLMEQGGQASEWTYPYRSYFGNNFNTCSFNATQTTPVAQISSFVALPSNEYAPVLNAVGTAGPVVVAGNQTKPKQNKTKQNKTKHPFSSILFVSEYAVDFVVYS